MSAPRERRSKVLAAAGWAGDEGEDRGSGHASVVVVVRDGAGVIGRCLESLLAQRGVDFDVIVVDDGSTDATAAIAGAGGDPRVTVCRNEGAGISAARNTGLRNARGAFVAYVDADGYAAPGWLAAACAALEGDPTLGAVTSLVFFDAAPTVLNGAGGTMDVRGEARDICFGEALEDAQIPAEVLYPMGNGMVFRHEALTEIEGFDETLTYEYDDVEAGIRLWKAGWRVAPAPGAVLDHGYGQAAASRDRSLLHQRHRIRTVLAHAPARTLPRFLAGEMPWLVIPTEVRGLMREAWGWNARHASEPLRTRLRWRGRMPVPRRLLAPGRAKFPELPAPPEPPWLYGWYPSEEAPGGRFRWAVLRAGYLAELDRPASGVALEYRLPPGSPGARLNVRVAGAAPTEGIDLEPGGWRRAVLERPLGPGSHEVTLSSPYAYEDARRRRLAIAVRRIETLQ